jgi:aquaporin Z
MEATGLAAVLMSAGLFGTLLGAPESSVHQAVTSPFLRRVLMGLAMGTTVIAIIYSPWGKQSGAHLNPVTTLTFYRLGKVAPLDACAYIVAQFLGALFGATLIGALLECDFL